MAINMLEYCQRMSRLKDIDTPTKKQFGELMHDDLLTNEEKWDIVRKVESVGGYACLLDVPIASGK